MSRRLRADLLVVAAALLLSGCATPSHLVFYQTSILGIDVSTSADNSTVHAKVGYDRQTGTIIPKTKVKGTPESAEEQEAMSVVSRSRIKVEWFRPSEICERFATGQAARNVARHGAAGALKSDGSGAGPATCEGF
jgi:hypothetical protein